MEMEKKNNKNTLLNNLEKIHTTEFGYIRIKKNLNLDVSDIIEWCKDKISSPDALITKAGKNWYVEIENCILTINSYNYSIITAHTKK